MLEQDVMNTIVGNISLHQLNDDAKESCEKGHEMEHIFSKDLMRYTKEGKFPYGHLDEITTIGIAAKQGEKYSKASVDHIIGVKGEDSKRDLLLLEFKSQVKQETEQKEQDRVKRLIHKGLMREDDISLELS